MFLKEKYPPMSFWKDNQLIRTSAILKRLGCCKYRAKLSWDIFISLDSHLLSFSEYDLTSSWPLDKSFGVFKQSVSFQSAKGLGGLSDNI